MATNFGVKKRKHEDFNKLLKRYKKWYSEFGIRQEITNRKEFIKPSAKKRRKMDEAKRMQQIEDKLYKKENGYT